MFRTKNMLSLISEQHSPDVVDYASDGEDMTSRQKIKVTRMDTALTRDDYEIDRQTNEDSSCNHKSALDMISQGAFSCKIALPSFLGPMTLKVNAPVFKPSIKEFVPTNMSFMEKLSNFSNDH